MFDALSLQASASNISIA